MVPGLQTPLCPINVPPYIWVNMAPVHMAPCFCMSRAIRLRLDFEKSPIKLNQLRVKTHLLTLLLRHIYAHIHSPSLIQPSKIPVAHPSGAL